MLSLPVGLRVVPRNEAYYGPHFTKEGFPDTQDELGATARQDVLQETVAVEVVLEQVFHNLKGRG